MKNKDTIKNIISIVITVVLVAAHVAIGILIWKATRYYQMYPALFNYILIIVICIFAIIDIIYFIGFRNKDLVQKIIVSFMAILLAVTGVYGTVVMTKTDELVDNVVETGNEEKYENIAGLFASYNEKYANVTSLTDLKSFGKIKVGVLTESTTDSISAIGKEKLDEAGVSYDNIGYTNNTDLLFALIGGEVDVAIFSNMYRAVFRADENVDYTQYLDQMNEFGEFNKDIAIESNTSTKNLSKDPFNVLLIGWSPIIGSTTIGLADAIIVATVNPQTYTVSMMSIARDSYVPISCYGGECDKINSGRGTSMDCFVSTVENLIGEDIDFYMEINFYGFAEMCGLLGGIPINNPVSFELDGIYVPAGEYVADGWQALQFARERHHMPNGDFDRQQHQKEVIMQVAKIFLKHDLTFALDIFNDISEHINTNLTLSQLSSVFNMLTSTKNYTGVSLFNMLDMHALRITGYADWHYNDDYELPLWIYRLYQGSIDESLEHMQDVMGNYKTINQNKGFYFSTDTPYVREPFYSLSYNEEEYHETLPPYYINLTNKTFEEVKEWARANGVTLNPTFIGPDDERYDESLDGMVISQSIAYGKKISKYPVCNITVMGNGKRKVKLPDYSDWGEEGYERAKMWCKDNELEYEKHPTYIAKDNPDGFKSGELDKLKYDEDTEIVHIYYYMVCGENSSPTADGKGCSCNEGYQDDGTDIGACKLTVVIPTISSNPCGGTNSTCELTVGTGIINYVIKYEYSHDIAKDAVISVSPTVGTKIITGSTVTVTISKGQNPDETQVPSLIGLAKDNALATCQSKELVASIEEVFSDTVLSGTVVDQSISANSYVNKGTAITIYVSKGKEQFPVPNFVGMSKSQAESNCGNFACSFTGDEDGNVTVQDVEAGETKDKGSPITLTITASGE